MSRPSCPICKGDMRVFACPDCLGKMNSNVVRFIKLRMEACEKHFKEHDRYNPACDVGCFPGRRAHHHLMAQIFRGRLDAYQSVIDHIGAGKLVEGEGA